MTKGRPSPFKRFDTVVVEVVSDERLSPEAAIRLAEQRLLAAGESGFRFLKGRASRSAAPVLLDDGRWRWRVFAFKELPLIPAGKDE